MNVDELTCIGCPLGCPLTVTIDKENVTVTGNTCPKGEIYGKKEVTNPTRVLAGTVTVVGASIPRLPVKTQSDIPKDQIWAVMNDIHKVVLAAPVKLGDVVLENAGNTGVSVVSCRTLEAVITL